jgi:hypothetical protein
MADIKKTVYSTNEQEIVRLCESSNVLSQQVALLAEGLAQWMNTCKCDCKGCAELIVAIAKVGQIK